MSYFDAHMKKVEKLNSPLLVIGLGGTGAYAVRKIKHDFSRRFFPEKSGSVELDHPPKTAYLVIDTDPNEVRVPYKTTKLEENTEFLSIQSNISYLLSQDGHNLSSQEKFWLDASFYTDRSLREQAAIDGAGTYRQLSRLMLYRKVQDVRTKLSNILSFLAAEMQGSPAGTKKINIMLVTGLSGGTGSGTFLDIAYLVRDVAARINQRIVLDFYAVAPDLTIAHHAQGDSIKEKIYQTNSFAALKELDYWMNIDTRRRGDLGDDQLMVDYGSGNSVLWNCPPFDSVTMLCATNTDGTLLANAYEAAMNSISESVMFMFADEANTGGYDVVMSNDRTNQNDIFSFQSARSNEYALINELKHPYPEGYMYRSIGAFSNNSQAENIVTYEGNLLFQDVRAFCEKPENQPSMKGTDPDDFFKNVYAASAQNLSTTFLKNTEYDKEMFSKQSPWDQNAMHASAEAITPHMQPFENWRRTQIAVMEESKHSFAKKMVTVFYEEAQKYIAARGPDAFNTLLTDPQNGIIRKYEEKKEQMTDNARSAETEVGTLYHNARSVFAEFKSWRLPNPLALLKQPQLFKQYIDTAQGMYVLTQQQFFYEAMAYALEEVLRELRGNTINTVAFVCQALSEITRKLNIEVQKLQNSKQNDSLIISGEQLTNKINSTYQANENREKLLRVTLKSAADCVVASSEVRSAEDAMERLVPSLQTMMDDIFKEINNLSISEQLIDAGQGGTPDAICAYVQQTLAPALEAGAKAHFALTENYGGAHCQNSTIISLVSVPQGQEYIRSGMKDYLLNSKSVSGGVLKNSVIDDRLFWMNVVSGLPLCAYRYLSDYENVYENNRTRVGLHLFKKMDNIIDAKYDWLRLPSPNPYFLFQKGEIVNPLLNARKQQTDALLDGALAQGFISLDTTPIDPNAYSATFTWLVDEQGTRLDEAGAGEMLESLPLMPEEGKEAVARANEKQKLLNQVKQIEQLLTRRAAPQTVEMKYIMHRLDMFSGYLNLTSEFSVQQKTAYEKCFKAYAYYVFAKRPLLLDMLEEQMRLARPIEEALQARETRIKAIEKMEKEFEEGVEQFKANARTLTNWLVYDLIKFNFNRYLFRDFSGNYEADGTLENVLVRMAELQGANPPVWQGFLPNEYLLVEWFGGQDKTREPFATLIEAYQKIQDDIGRMTGTPQEIEKLTIYRDAAKKLENDMKKQETLLRANQKPIQNVETYNSALAVVYAMRIGASSVGAQLDKMLP